MQSTPVCRLQGSGGGWGLPTDDDDTDEKEVERSAAKGGRDRGREGTAEPDEVEQGGEVFCSSRTGGLVLAAD